jgi:hypothetical protein
MTLHELGIQPTLRKPKHLTRGELHRRVAELEAEHSMTTPEFVALWRKGGLPEESPFTEWAHLSTILSHIG